jgi:hypothetical protein
LLRKSEKYDFCIPAKFITRRIFTKSFKKSKNSVTLPKTGLSAVWTFDPLGVELLHIAFLFLLLCWNQSSLFRRSWNLKKLEKQEYYKSLFKAIYKNYKSWFIFEGRACFFGMVVEGESKALVFCYGRKLGKLGGYFGGREGN